MNCDYCNKYLYDDFQDNASEELKKSIEAHWKYVLWQHKQADKIIQKLIEKIKSGGKHGQI